MSSEEGVIWRGIFLEEKLSLKLIYALYFILIHRENIATIMNFSFPFGVQIKRVEKCLTELEEYFIYEEIKFLLKIFFFFEELFVQTPKEVKKTPLFLC